MPRVTKIGPVAVSLSGGGAHGAWSVGALKNIWEEQDLAYRDMRIIYGTSTGSLISAMLGAVAVTGDTSFFDELEHIYRNTADGDILIPSYDEDDSVGWDIIRPALDLVLGDNEVLLHAVLALITKQRSIYSTRPLRELIDRFLSDSMWKRIIKAGARQRKPVEVGFCITSLQSGRSMMVTNRTHQDIGVLKRAMLASTSEPVLMPAVDVFGDGQQWVDGGARDINPWKYALESPHFNTIKSLLCVSCQTGDPEPGEADYDNLPSLLMRTLSVLINGVFKDDIDQLELLKYKSKFTKHVLHVQPSKALVGDGLVFNPQSMRAELRMGFRDAAKYFSNRE